MDEQPPPLGFQPFPQFDVSSPNDGAGFPGGAASATQQGMSGGANTSTSNGLLGLPDAGAHRRASLLGGGVAGGGGLSHSTSGAFAGSTSRVARNKSMFGNFAFGEGSASGPGGIDASVRSGAPPLNRRATMMMGGGSSMRNRNADKNAGSASGNHPLGDDDDDDDDDDDGSKRRRRALEAGAMSHAEASAAAFEQYNQQSLQRGGGGGGGIGGTNITASGLYDPSAASIRRNKLDAAARDLAENEVESEGSDSSSSGSEVDFFVKEGGDSDDSDDSSDSGGSGGGGDLDAVDDEDLDEMSPEELEEYLKGLESSRKETMMVFKRTQEQLRYRDFASLGLRYKLAGMIDPAVLGETEIPPQWLTYGRIYAVVISVFALFHAVAATIETVKDAEDIGKYLFILTTAVSAIDFIFRVVTIAPRASLLGLLYDLLVLIASVMHIADIYGEYAIYFALLRSLRAFRAVMLFEAYETCRDMFLVQKAIIASAGPLLIVGAIFVIGLMLFSTAMWVAEQSGYDTLRELRLQPCTSAQPCEDRFSPFQSVPNAMWLIVSAMSTVGLGDVVPNSTVSRVFVAVSMIFGVFMIAFPAMILVANLQGVRKSYFAMVDRRTARLQVLAVMYLAKKEQTAALRQQKEALLASNGMARGEDGELIELSEGGGAAAASEGGLSEGFSFGSPMLPAPPLQQQSSTASNPLQSPFGSNVGVSASSPNFQPATRTGVGFANSTSNTSPHAGAGAGRVVNPFAKPSESLSSPSGGGGHRTAGIVGFTDSAIDATAGIHDNNPLSGGEDTAPNSHHSNNSADATTAPPLSGFTPAPLRAVSSPPGRGISNSSGENSLKKSGSVLTAAPPPARSHSAATLNGTTNKNNNANSFRRLDSGLGGGGRLKSGANLKRNASNLQRTASSLRRVPSTLQQAVVDSMKEGGNSGSGSGQLDGSSSGFWGGGGGMNNNTVLTITNVLQQGGGAGSASSPLGALGGFASLSSFYGRNGAGGGGAGGGGGLGGSVVHSNGGSFYGNAPLSAVDIAAAHSGAFEDPLQPEPIDAGTGVMYCGEALLVEGQREGLKALQRVCVAGSSSSGGALRPGAAAMPFLPTVSAAGGGGPAASAAIGNPGVTLDERMLLYYSPICRLLMDKGGSSDKRSSPARNARGGGAADASSHQQSPIPLVSQVVLLNEDTALFQLTLIVDDDYARTIAAETMLNALDADDNANNNNDAGTAYGDVIARSLPMKGLEVSVVAGLPSNMLLLRRSDSAEIGNNQLPLVFLVRHVSKYGIPTGAEDRQRRESAELKRAAQQGSSGTFSPSRSRNIYKKDREAILSESTRNNNSGFIAAANRNSRSGSVPRWRGAARTGSSSEKENAKGHLEIDDEDEESNGSRLVIDSDAADEDALNHSSRDSKHPDVDPSLIAANIGRELAGLQLRLLFRHSEKAASSWRETNHVNRSLLTHADILRELRAIAVNVSPSLYWPEAVRKTVAKSVRERRQNVAFVKPEHVPMFVERMLNHMVEGQLAQHARQVAEAAAAADASNTSTSASIAAAATAAATDRSTIIITNRSEVQAAIGDLFTYHCRELYKADVPKMIRSAIFAESLVAETDQLLEVNIDFLRHGTWPLGTVAVEYAFSAPVCERISLVEGGGKGGGASAAASSAAATGVGMAGVVPPQIAINPKLANRFALQRVKAFVNEDNFEASVRHATGEDTNDLYDLIYEQNKAHARTLMQQMGITNAVMLTSGDGLNTTATAVSSPQQQQQQQKSFHPPGSGMSPLLGGGHRDPSANSADDKNKLSIGFELYNTSAMGASSNSNNNAAAAAANLHPQPLNAGDLAAQPSAPSFFFDGGGATGGSAVFEDPEAARRRRQDYHRKLMQSVNAAASGKLALPAHLVDGGGGDDEGDGFYHTSNNLFGKPKDPSGAGNKKRGSGNGVGHIPQDPKRRGNVSWYDSRMSNARGGGGGSAIADGNAEALWRLQHTLGFHNNTAAALHGTAGGLSPTAGGDAEHAMGGVSPSAVPLNSGGVSPATHGIAITISPSTGMMERSTVVTAAGSAVFSPLDGLAPDSNPNGDAVSPSVMSPLTVILDDNGNITNLTQLREQKAAMDKAKAEAEEAARNGGQLPSKKPAKRLVSYGTGSTPAAIAAAKAKREKEEAEYFDKVLNKGKKAQEAFLERKRVLEEAHERQRRERIVAARETAKNGKNAKTKSGVAEWAEGFKRFFNSNVFTSTPHSLQIKDDPSSPRRTR